MVIKTHPSLPFKGRKKADKHTQEHAHIESRQAHASTCHFEVKKAASKDNNNQQQSHIPCTAQGTGNGSHSCCCPRCGRHHHPCRRTLCVRSVCVCLSVCASVHMRVMDNCTPDAAHPPLHSHLNCATTHSFLHVH